MKRYCQILILPDDEQAITAYDEVHSRVWPEIKELRVVINVLTNLKRFHRPVSSSLSI